MGASADEVVAARSLELLRLLEVDELLPQLSVETRQRGRGSDMDADTFRAECAGAVPTPVDAPYDHRVRG